MTLAEALARLGLDAAAGPQAVTQAFRARRSSLHPDKGGDASEFALLVQAHDLALAAAQTCPRCLGSGHQLLVRGFSQVRLVCPGCGGSGNRN